MTNLIAERPWLLLAMLAALAAAALYGWMQTGKRGPLIAGGLLLALMPLAWFVSDQWVTDREKIQLKLTETAEALQRNDIDAALQLIDPAMRSVLTTAQADLSRFRFSDARVTRIRSIELNTATSPPSAAVDLNVNVLVSHQSGQLSDIRVLRRVQLDMHRLADGQWYVRSYNHIPISGQPDSYSPAP